MEKSIREAFGLKPADPLRVSSLSLAYVGDAVFALFFRTVLLEQKNGPNGALHSRALAYVSAVGQAKMAQGLQEMLTEEEAAVFRRGRNAKPEHGAKNATGREYHLATGLEALIGYLYLQGREDRIIELMKAGMPYAEQ
ncbi:MAG: ribonuclease III [Lachnospiraceae bacterium]|nr:ribonuclease III [Lachnospiraceae bacterium]